MSADPRVSTEAAIARVSAQVEDIGREIGLLRKDIAGDFGRVDARLEVLHGEVKHTNGKVRGHDLDLAEIRVRADERAKAQADLARDQDKRLNDADRRWTRIKWSVALAVTVLIAIAGWTIDLLAG